MTLPSGFPASLEQVSRFQLSEKAVRDRCKGIVFGLPSSFEERGKEAVDIIVDMMRIGGTTDRLDKMIIEYFWDFLNKLLR